MSEAEEQNELITGEKCKVVIIGESGVGKTSIISNLLEKGFEENKESTTGATYSQKRMFFEKYNRPLCFDIWDTAGQEKFRSLTKMFYKDAAAAILVYDMTSQRSFDEIKKYWIKQIKEFAPKKLILALVANKSDLIEKEAVEEAIAKELAKENKAYFGYVSAKLGTGINELFIYLGNSYLDPDFVYSDEAYQEEKETKRNRTNSVLISSKNQNGINKNAEQKKKCCG